MVLERWTRAVVRNRLSIVAGWILVIVVGLFAATNLDKHLTTSLAIPGSDSAKADEILAARFNENIEGTFTILLRLGNATPTQIKEFKTKIATAVSVLPSAQISQERVFDGIIFASVGTSLKLTDAAAGTEDLRSALIDQGLKGALVTGPPAIHHDVTPVLATDLHRGQILAVLLALLLLILVLGACWAVLVPFVFAAGTISLALTLVYLMSQKILMVLYIPNIIELIGLGLAIDYSLLIVHRFRREMMGSDELKVEDAIVKTMTTAGRTVLLSGISVAIGLATLLLVPIPYVRSLGLAGLLVPVVSVFAALTLQPALLSYVGKSGVTSTKFPGLLARKDLMTGFFARLARLVIHRPTPILGLALAVLAIVASSMLGLKVTPTSLTTIPANLESARALVVVGEHIGPGLITPNEIVIDLGAPSQATTLSVRAARTALANKILKDPEVFIVATDEKSSYVDSTGQYLRMFVIGRHAFGAEASQTLIHKLRDGYLLDSGFSKETKIYLGGVPAQGVDLIERIIDSFPWIALLILIVAYFVLARAFRSALLPLLAIALDMVSIATAFGAMVLVSRFGFGSSILGTYRLDQIEAWVLIFLFAVLFGLSMDYEVFIVSRMREARDRGASNSEAIIEALANTGGVVTAAAIILVGALSGLVFGHFAGLQQLGVGLAFGVLIDATIIRGLVLPSSMALMGRWNWWLPETMARLLNTKTSPLEVRGTRL